MTSKIARIISYIKQQLALLQSLPLIAKSIEELLASDKQALEKKAGSLTLKLADPDSLRSVDLENETRNNLYILPVTRDNLYSIQDELVAAFNILPVLTFAPSDFHARLHAHNLFHQSISLRRTVFAHNYYEAVTKQLAAGLSDHQSVKIADCLGKASAIAILKDIISRISTKLGWWLIASRLRAKTTVLSKRPQKAPNSARKVLITGWYGTETAGDKAILMELIDVLDERYGNVELHITSIVPSYSLFTNEELGIAPKVYDLKKLPYGELVDTDLIVFGGGPVMDSSQLEYIGVLFRWAKKRGVPTLLFGCGVGPLKKPANQIIARDILAATSTGFFRDKESMLAAVEMGYAGAQLYASDPALRYVYRWRKENSQHPKAPGAIVTMLRAQTSEYSGDASQAQKRLSDVMRVFLSGQPTPPIIFLSMHSFWLGNDDRTYNLDIARNEVGSAPDYPLQRPQTLHDILTAIASADYGIPMRFHGHIFLLAMGTPFIGVDYTGKGGKVSNLIARYKLNDYELTIDNSLSAEAISARWESLTSNRASLVAQIEKQRDADIRSLDVTYDRIFDVLQSEGLR